MRSFERNLMLGWWCAVSLLLCVPSQPAQAALDPSQVLLLYSSTNAESLAIANAYMARYPNEPCDDDRPGSNILTLDLEIDYQDPIDFNDAKPGDVTNKYVHPETFISAIRDKVVLCLDKHPEILAIVTTRGLPAAIATDFTPNTGTTLRSVEAQLARIGNITDASDIGPELNPYYGRINVSFESFLKDACLDGGAHMAGKMYLVSRLDSSKGTSTNPDEPSAVENVVSLIGRHHRIEKSSVSVVMDSCNTVEDKDALLGDMAGAGWFVYENPDPADPKRDFAPFLHGFHQPSGYTCGRPPFTCTNCGEWDERVEGRYYPYPELVHVGPGHHHMGTTIPDGLCVAYLDPEGVCTDYVRYYDAHPSGLFVSLESYNGWCLHDPNDLSFEQCAGNCHSHGNVLDWIAAGGAFTLGHVAEPSPYGGMHATYCVINLYLHGLSWGEAAYTQINVLGHVKVAIGDPLATVDVFNADLNDDTAVGGLDLGVFLGYWTGLATYSPCPPTLQADFNGDCKVDGVDMADLLASYHDPRESDPPSGQSQQPTPPQHCLPGQPLFPSEFLCRGDINNDWYVNAADLTLVLDLRRDFLGCACPDLDVNGNGQFDADDIDTVERNQGDTFMTWADVNGQPGITCADVDLFWDHLTCRRVPYDALYDLNCDQLINGVDLRPVFAARARTLNPHPGTPGSATCSDAAVVHDCLCPPPGDPRCVVATMDADCNGVVDGCDWQAFIDYLLHKSPPEVCGQVSCFGGSLICGSCDP